MILSIPISKIDIDKYRADYFLREFCSDIRYVKKMNQIGNSDVFILVIKQSGKNGYILSENGKVTKSIFLPKNSEIGCALSQILFKRDGRLISHNTTDSMTITLRYKDKYKKMTIVPVSGRILIREGIYE